MTSGSLMLAVRHARHHPARTLLLIACVTITFLVPIITQLVSRHFEQALTARARSTPVAIGAAGSRFDLVLAALYFRRSSLRTLSMADYESLRDAAAGTMIPVNTRFTARGLPIVAASADYAAFRGLRCSAGAMPALVGQCVLGASAARLLGLGAGDTLYSDQLELYNLARPAAFKMHITGVLAPHSSPDDLAVLTDIKTAWVLEGLSHSHADAAQTIPPALILDRSDSSVVVSESFVENNEVTAKSASTLHLHASSQQLPLSCILFVPETPKEATILSARLNAGRELQAVAPSEVIDELLGYVVRVRSLLNVLAIIMAAMTITLLSLVTALSVKVRQREVDTLRHLGASSRTIVMLFGWDCGCIIGAGALAAVGLAAAIWTTLPDPVKLM